MTRHYSARSFFRQTPNDLLARYGESRGLGSALDLAAWLALPEDRRQGLEAEFREIFEMSCEKGTWAILDEARHRWRDDPGRLGAFIETLSLQPSQSHRALVTRLNHRGCWKNATRVRQAELLPHWLKRKHLGHRPAAMDPSSLEHLADLMRTYFQRSEARGGHCLVEHSRRGGLDCFHAYPEDYSQQRIEWVGGKLVLKQHYPAFEVVFVYSREEGSLDVNFPGPYRALQPLQEMFAAAILKLDRLPGRGDGRVYDLDPLRRRGFEFACGRGSGIESVALRLLRLSSRARRGDRVTLEADDSIHPDAIHDVLEVLDERISLRLFSVTRAELVARVAADGEKPARRVPICLTSPDSCSLGYGERDLKLRSMLKDSGLEPAGGGGGGEMSPEAVLLDLGSRAGASPSREVRVNSCELARWPREAVAALKSQKLIRRVQRARSTVCQGCGRQCAMPVEWGANPSMPWVVCDKRGDINRVPVPADRLAQWRTSAGILGRVVAGGLSIHWRGLESEGGRVLEIGVALAGNRRRMLKLRLEGELALAAGSSALPLSEVLRFGEGGYRMDDTRIRRWLDVAAEEPPLTATRIRREARKLDTQERHKTLQKAYRTLKREKPGMSGVWYARQIARSGLGGGLRPGTIRKNMKKARTSRPNAAPSASS